MMIPARSLVMLAAAALLAACTSTPLDDPQRYKPALTPDFANAAATSGEPVGEFWRAFGDADLDALIAQAVKANADIRIASANLQEARALARFSDAQRMPTVDATGRAARVRSRNTQGVAETGSAFSAGFDVAWEADLFGRVSNDRQAAAATVLAGEAGVRAAQVSVAAEVARNFFELRGLQEQLRVAKASLDTQQAALKLTQARESVGRGTVFDSERAKALVQTTAAAVPALEAAVNRARYRIAVLSGQAPTALDARLAEAKPLPGLKAMALGNIGSPESLLRRRPDVAAAEAQLSAAAARVGVAKSDLFPRITLGGSLGLNAGRFSELGNSAGRQSGVEPAGLWPPACTDCSQRSAQRSGAGGV
jgi:outer membrane protein, multidrug efflux system